MNSSRVRLMSTFVVGMAVMLAGLCEVNAAPIIGAGTPIPDDNVLLNFAGTGLDWVYAAPLGPAFSTTEAPSFRAGEGWRFATAAEWALRPDWTDFIQPGFTVTDVGPFNSFSDHTKYKFASEHWSIFAHVDLDEVSSFGPQNGDGLGTGGSADVWYVRTSAAAVIPEPSSIALLGLGGLGLVLMQVRRRRRQ